MLRKIVRIFAIHWGDVLQYRLDLFLWTLVGTLTPLISMALWYTVSKNAASGPLPAEVLVYYMAITFTFTATMAWHGYFLAMEILNGDIVKHLLRPIAMIWHTISNNVVEKLIKLPILAGIFIIATGFYPELPQLVGSHTQEIPLFFMSLLLALIISFSVDTSLGFLAFYLEDSNEIIRFKFLFDHAASGILIPYAFMPEALRNVLTLLPFRYMYAAPVEILLGQTTNYTALQMLSIQACWAIAMSVIAWILWRKGLRRYAVPGQ